MGGLAAELLTEDRVGGAGLGELGAQGLLAGEVGVGDGAHVRLGGDVEVGGLEALEGQRIGEVGEFEGDAQVVGPGGGSGSSGLVGVGHAVSVP